MNITFVSLAEGHLPLLLEWLETPHVKAWWDQDVQWTPELIQDKYGSYINGYKIEDGERKEMHAYIISADHKPIGYIQLYNVYDFPRSTPLVDLPKSLAAFDIFIGDPEYIGKNIGSNAIQQFLDQYCAPDYEFTFVDPDVNNIAAIKSYAKAGFEELRLNTATKELWMLRNNIDQTRR